MLIKLEGAVLRSLPITGLERVRDLLSFDGPLLTQFRNRRGDHYLYYWCDCDDTVNRWMVLRVSETNILRYVNRVIPLDYIVPGGAEDDFVYFTDVDASCVNSRVTLVDVDSVPSEYTPAQGAYLDDVVKSDDRSYSILIEGSFKNNELTELPSKFAQAYAVAYGLNVLKPGHVETFPWRGDGYSSMHFYKWMMRRLPGEDRVQVRSMKYASPGFIQFSLHRPTADLVAECIAKVSDKKSDANVAFTDLRSYIKDKKLNELKVESVDTNGPPWQLHNPELFKRTQYLLNTLAMDAAELFAATAGVFEASKIAISYVHRLRKLAAFAKDGLVRFPAVR